MLDHDAQRAGTGAGGDAGWHDGSVRHRRSQQRFHASEQYQRGGQSEHVALSRRWSPLPARLVLAQTLGLAAYEAAQGLGGGLTAEYCSGRCWTCEHALVGVVWICFTRADGAMFAPLCRACASLPKAEAERRLVEQLGSFASEMADAADRAAGMREDEL
jgi:hypothetical protein